MMLGPWLVVVGVLIALAGVAIWLGVPIGRLPGDVVIQRGGFTLYLPITTSILMSLLWMIVAALLRR
jgi:hypothetical protein